MESYVVQETGLSEKGQFGRSGSERLVSPWGKKMKVDWLMKWTGEPIYP